MRSSPSVANALINTRHASVEVSTVGLTFTKSQNKLVSSWYACSLIASNGADMYAGELAPLPPPLMIVPLPAICGGEVPETKAR